MSGKAPKASASSRDPLFAAIVLLVACVCGWLLVMPFVPAVGRIALKRFHLETESFPLWCLQSPIPAMYNFGNQYEIRDLPEDLFTPVLDSRRPRYINHFPARIVTFANGRYTLLQPGQDRWLTYRSSYRGQTLETKVHVKPLGDGHFQYIRQSSRFIDPESIDPESIDSFPLGID